MRGGDDTYEEATAASPTAMAGLLAGVRVVEAGTFIAGPFAGTMLGDLGADVIKVEMPSGDPAWRFGFKHSGVSAMGTNLNRGKRRQHIDLKSASGRDELLDLLANADVFLHNWRPGAAEGFGLEAAEICERFPRLIYVSVSGFGRHGPRSKGPVFDTLLQAASGLGEYEGELGRPRLFRSYVADKVSATYATQAALAGLVARATTGRGGHFEVSMLDAMAYFNFPDMGQHRTFLEAQPDLAPGRVPIVATSDGWIALAPVRGVQLAATVTALGHSEWVADLKAAPTPAAMLNRLLDLIGPIIATMSTAACEALLSEADVPVTAVLSIDDHLADDQTARNRLYSIMETPVGPARRARHPLIVDGRIIDAAANRTDPV